MHPFFNFKCFRMKKNILIKFNNNDLIIITFNSKTTPRQFVVNEKRIETIIIVTVNMTCMKYESFRFVKKVFKITSLQTNASNGKLHIIIKA